MSKRMQYKCLDCGGSNILHDSWARWNPELQRFELENVFDQGFCIDCDGECSLDIVEWEEK